MLPELDGIRLAILRLHNYQDRSVLDMHASGPRCDTLHGPDELYGEVALRVEVVPPLSRADAWIELLAAGRSAEVRATLPLHWESFLF